MSPENGGSDGPAAAYARAPIVYLYEGGTRGQSAQAGLPGAQIERIELGGRGNLPRRDDRVSTLREICTFLRQTATPPD
jgi:hypothetical protein